MFLIFLIYYFQIFLCGFSSAEKETLKGVIESGKGVFSNEPTDLVDVIVVGNRKEAYPKLEGIPNVAPRWLSKSNELGKPADINLYRIENLAESSQRRSTGFESDAANRTCESTVLKIPKPAAEPRKRGPECESAVQKNPKPAAKPRKRGPGFPCPECGKRWRDMNGLRKHMGKAGICRPHTATPNNPTSPTILKRKQPASPKQIVSPKRPISPKRPAVPATSTSSDTSNGAKMKEVVEDATFVKYVARACEPTAADNDASYTGTCKPDAQKNPTHSARTCEPVLRIDAMIVELGRLRNEVIDRSKNEIELAA